LYVGRDHAHQAAAEALGRLPLGICGPEMTTCISTDSSDISWRQLITQQPFVQALPFVLKGRSLTARLPNKDMVVIKMARRVEDVPDLRREIQWLKHIASMPLPGGYRFDVPRVVEIKGAAMFRINGLPSELKPHGIMDSQSMAIGFVSSDAYYCYPNDSRGGSIPHAEEFIEMMGRNAFLFGWLCALGIVHEAPIPLFHNRVQQDRRRDGGVYEWCRAGRLDRWLASSAYPNFGRSGLRDFEHFTSFHGREIELYRHMGNQLLSLLLVAGSYFRAKDAQLMGRDQNGKPIDARYLFDKDLLYKALKTIFHYYYLGFVGIAPHTSPPVNIGGTVDRMIDEMGVDRYMEEYLRVADQQQMSQSAFETFLADRGYDDGHISTLKKGDQDLAIHSGPHLGAFNRGISLPEIIEAAAAMAAVCVVDRFIRFKTESPALNTTVRL
jgi:hypothetical protein